MSRGRCGRLSGQWVARYGEAADAAARAQGQRTLLFSVRSTARVRDEPACHRNGTRAERPSEPQY